MSSVHALSSLSRGTGTGSRSPYHVAAGADYDPNDAFSVPDLSMLSGSDLEMAARAYQEKRGARLRAERLATADAMGDPRAHFNDASDQLMESDTRAPGWAGFFGALGAKADAAGAQGKDLDVQYRASRSPASSPSLRGLLQLGRP